MSTTSDERVTIALADGRTTSGLLQVPAKARALLVLGHGAGAGMTHPFLAAVANGLGARDIATLRYQFLAMEAGGRRPDPPKVAQAVVRAAVAEAARRQPDLPLFAGGKSFGGRMTSQAQAAAPLPGVRGLAFLGFPLHPAGAPGTARADHLSAVQLPLLFLQGTRDSLAERALIEGVCAQLGPRATLFLIPEADHSFHVPARSGRRDADVLEELLDVLVRWMLAQPTEPLP